MTASRSAEAVSLCDHLVTDL